MIDSKEKWMRIAKEIVPLLPDYMAEMRDVDKEMIERDLNGLVEKEDWAKLYERFQDIWFWLPDKPHIRHGPFFNLCDLCSEYLWIFREEEK